METRRALLVLQSHMPNVSLAEIAELIDEPVAYLMRIERGVSDMPPSVMDKIVDALEEIWRQELAEADIPELDI